MIVVTDRVVLDQQLQDTIYQFEHKRGVVQRIDESSRQLAEALENAVPVIITTMQIDGESAHSLPLTYVVSPGLLSQHNRGLQVVHHISGTPT